MNPRRIGETPGDRRRPRTAALSPFRRGAPLDAALEDLTDLAARSKRAPHTHATVESPSPLVSCREQEGHGATSPTATDAAWNSTQVWLSWKLRMWHRKQYHRQGRKKNSRAAAAAVRI